LSHSKKLGNHILSFFVSLTITFSHPILRRIAPSILPKSDGIALWHSIICNNNRSRTGHRLNHTENKRANVICKKKAWIFCDFNKKSTVCTDPKKLDK
ncbi:hypothetical protein, partial [Abiotrophia defectiva]|uniref:hypothetical protein n=1 Tax=uncultured Abiotrophia sp. TaxID=316094 RepID=UPI0028ECBB7A